MLSGKNAPYIVDMVSGFTKISFAKMIFVVLVSLITLVIDC